MPRFESVLHAALDQAPVGVAIWDRDLRYRVVNAHLAEINGVPPEAHLGRTIPEVLPGLAFVADTLREVLASGEPAVGRRVLGRLPGYEEPRWRLASYFPVRDATGEAVAVAAVIVDVTEQVRVEEAAARARVELERERGLLEQVVTQVPIGIAVTWGPEHRFALINEPARAMIPARGELVGRLVTEVFPELAELVDATYGEAYRTGRPIVQSGLPVPFADQRSFEGFRYYDVTFAPVLLEGRSAGIVVTFVEVTERVRERTELERELAEEHRLTELLQRALLPAALPAAPGLALAARYEPARHRYVVGGDFYDVVPWDGDRWLLVLGDVSGKGPRAASVSAIARAALRAGLLYETGPAALVGALNAVLLRELDGDQFVTLVLAVLAPRAAGGHDVEVVLAGHPPALVVRATGEVVPAGRTGPALGVEADAAWPVDRTLLRPGDALLLYTDGLVEARRPRLVEPDALAATVAAAAVADPEALIDAVYEALVGGTGGGPDDVAMLAARAVPASAAGAARLEDALAAGG